MQFRNSTALNTDGLYEQLLRHTHPYRHDDLRVSVRYSRGADFSGSCYYVGSRIFVNIGRHVTYPYVMATHVAKATSNSTHWWREQLTVTLAEAPQLVLFIYLHELFHYLVKVSGRNPRRKEAMCDRFAARVLVDQYGCRIQRRSGGAAPREMWDFKDLDAFVATAPKQTRPAPRPIPVRVHPDIGGGSLMPFAYPSLLGKRGGAEYHSRDPRGSAVWVRRPSGQKNRE